MKLQKGTLRKRGISKKKKYSSKKIVIFFALIKVHFYSFVSVSNSCCSFLNFIFFFWGGVLLLLLQSCVQLITAFVSQARCCWEALHEDYLCVAGILSVKFTPQLLSSCWWIDLHNLCKGQVQVNQVNTPLCDKQRQSTYQDMWRTFVADLCHQK